MHGAGILKRHWKGLAYGDGYFAEPIPGNEHLVYANLQGGVPFLVDSRYGNVQTIHPYPKIIGSAGDLIIWDSRLWHGTLENRSKQSRWAIVTTLSSWWVKQAMDMPKSLPKKIYKKCHATNIVRSN